MLENTRTQFDDIERVVLTPSPTPLRPMDRLAAHLGWPTGSLWVKRDDLTEFAAGGNKVRKLEYLLPEALQRQATCLVTGGGVQSNHARATVAAAARSGLKARVVLDGREPDEYSGNLALDQILGARIVYQSGQMDTDLDQRIIDEATRAEQDGERPYVIPVGGSNPRGALGYVRCAREVREQLPEVGLVVIATGSAGTHAGLAAGMNDHARVLGVRVGIRADMRERVERMAAETAALAGLPTPDGTCLLDEDHLGEGYAKPTPECYDAIRLAARLEGIILDPVYTAKAMAALLSRARDGRLTPDRPVVFIHSGGMPGLLAQGRADHCARFVSDGTW